MERRKVSMIRPNLENLPPVVMPEGCVMRTFAPGDEQVWGEIMNTGVGTDWTVEKVREKLTGQPQFDPDGLFFATMDGKPVGSACAWTIEPGEREVGTVHMVCVLPEARGKNLGYLLVLRVLHYFREHGFTSASLSTDDGRVPAIKSYLRLGFEADCPDEESAEIWKGVVERIGG